MHQITASRPVRPLALRWLAAATALLAVGLATAACSPAPRRNVALFLDDGHPTAVLHHCPRAAITSLSVTDRTTPSAPDPDAPEPTGTDTPLFVPYWSVFAVDKDARPTQVRLLSVPAGWRLGVDTPFVLEEFTDGYEYYLDTNDVGFRGLEFSLADLESLPGGQVFAVAKNGEPEAMTRDEFARIASDAC